MGEILSRLGQLFVQSIPTVVFVFLLLAVLDRLFFHPLANILKQREEATLGAMARAREQAAVAEKKARTYEMAFQAAKQEVYRLREAERRSALSERENTLKDARAQSDAWLKEAQAGLEAEVARAKSELAKVTQSLASEITNAILGGAVGVDREGGVRP